MPKQQLAAAQLTSPQLASLFVEHNSDAVVTIDPGGNIVGWNPSAEKLYGYSQMQILHHPISVLFPRELNGEHLIRRANLTCERAVLGWETRQISKDGSEILLNVSISPFFDKAGKISARCMVTRELVQPDHSASRSREAQKLEAVGRLAGGIAHDFNNLLTVISGYNGLLRSSLPADSPLIGYASEVEKAADRAASLTSQLLVFSRHAVTAPEVLNLNIVAQDLQKMLERIIGADIKIQLKLAPDLENIKADPGQISQMLMNLAVNARDAMPHGGTLCIETCNIQREQPPGKDVEAWAPGPYVQIDVSDTGVGMDERTKEHLFEPFFTTKVKGKGTGLGLSIVYGIVSRMRGMITVTSELGKGSAFKLSFPATFETQKEPGKGSMEAYSDSKGRSTGSVILLVEDEDGVRLLVKEMLLKLGYKVYDTANAEEAIQVSANRKYDLLLTDVVMPLMGGRELALKLQKSRPAIKVLYMSGYVEDAGLVNFLTLGANFLLKPFTAEQLASQVKHSLEAAQVCAV